MSAPENVVQFERPQSVPALIPPAIYALAYHHHWIGKRFDRDVLEVWFTVADYGEHFGKRLVSYYAVKASASRRAFTARPGSDFVRDYCMVVGRRPRFELGPLRDFKDRGIRGRIETVTRNYRQKKLPKPMQYSIVRELLSDDCAARAKPPVEKGR